MNGELTNISGEDFTGEQYVEVTLLNKEGQEMTKIKTIVPGIGKGEIGEFKSDINVDYSNTYDYKIVKSN